MSNSRFKLFGFKLAPEVAQLGVCGAFLAIGGIRNRAGDPAFDTLLAEATRIIRAESHPYSTVSQCFRQFYDAIGRSNKRFVAAPENLLHLALQRGSIPRVNLLVDIYNLDSLQIN